MIITNISGQTELLTDFDNLVRKRRVNGERSLSFIVFETDRNAHSFPLVQEESIVEYDGDKYRIKKLREYIKGNTFVKDIQLTHHVFFDIIDDYQYSELSGTLNMTEVLNHVFSVTSWTWVNQGAFTGVEFENFGDGNALELFQIILERYGAEFDITGINQVTINNQTGTTRDVQFRYKHNINTIHKEIDSSNVSTFIKGFGKKNADGTYAVTAEYMSPKSIVYGVRHAPPVRDDRYTTHSSLLDHIKKVLIDTPNIMIEIDIVELKEQGIPIHEYNLGDTIYLIHEELGIDSTVRVMEYTDYPESFKSPSVVLSNFKKTLANTMVSFQQTSKTVKQYTDADGNLNLLVKKLYRNTDHYSDSTGDWYISPDDPNAYVHIGAGGLDVHKGLVRIERADGYATIIGGVIQHGFEVQGAYPPFKTAGIVDEGPWLRTLSNSRFENVQMYTFKHESRYLVARIGLKTEGANLSTMFFDIDTSNGSGATAVNIGSATFSGPDEYYVTEVTMDLGVPDGSIKVVYVRLTTSNTALKAYGRILNIRREL